MSLSVRIKKTYPGFKLETEFEHENGILGLLGASGCGKSLTLKCIAGIETPDEGRIVLNGRVLYDSEKGINVKPQQRHVGYLFQNYALFANMTVEKNILCGLNREKDKHIRREKLENALEIMQLKSQRNAYPNRLSGGQQQRVALARILVNEPELLLLDEPFSALDAFLRDQLQTKLKDTLAKFHKDVVLVSHSRDEIYHLCPKVALVDDGRIINIGETKHIFADPGSIKGAMLTGCKNITPAEKRSEYEVWLPEWGISLKTSQAVKDSICAVGIRAHYFNPKTRDNSFPVLYEEEMGEPFEVTILFRYENQTKNSDPVWWRIPKDKKTEVMPGELGIAPQNVLLLYNQEKGEGHETN